MATTIKYLILDGNNYKTISNGILTTVCTTADSDATIETTFRNSGLNDLSQINNDITIQVVNNQFTIVMFKSPA